MKDPAFLFYSSDFITGTYFMSDDQVGRYIRLICLQHQKGKIKPKDFDKLAKGDSEIIEKFVLDEEGNYYNERLFNEIIKRTKFSESRRRNLQGNKEKTSKPHMEEHMGAHMENVNENINIPFSDFWNLYDKKAGSKDKIEKKWRGLSDVTREKIMKYLPNYIKSTPDKQYRKNPETFLNNEAWEDEIINPKFEQPRPGYYKKLPQ